MMLGVMAAQHEVIDFDTASLVAMEYNAKIEKEVIVTIEEKLINDEEDDTADLQERSPVVVVMGHVDHGKTSIAGRGSATPTSLRPKPAALPSISAHIRVKVGDRYDHLPGYPRPRGLYCRCVPAAPQVTDIAVLVVAADDGIMPQTVEAINHAKAAGVSIIVAINKMDKPAANPDKVMQELTEYELVPEDWGGDVICVPVSAAHQVWASTTCLK